MVKCRVEGCEHGVFKNKRAEITHYHRAHTGRIKTPGQRAVLQFAGENGGTAVALSEPKVDRRTREWRQAHPKEAQPLSPRKPAAWSRKPKRVQSSPSQEVQINFCPKCGCNIHAVALGMAISQAKG